MLVRSKLNYLRIAPRKVRLVADLIRGKKTEEAKAILAFTVKKANQPLLKLLNSAIANAKNNLHLDPDNLYISKITVDEGPKYKRWMPRARGQAYEIQKKTSHITLILDEIKPAKKGKAKRKKLPLVKIPETGQKTIEEKEAEKKKQAFKPEFKLKPRPQIVRGIRQMFRRKSI